MPVGVVVGGIAGGMYGSTKEQPVYEGGRCCDVKESTLYALKGSYLGFGLALTWPMQLAMSPVYLFLGGLAAVCHTTGLGPGPDPSDLI